MFRLSYNIPFCSNLIKITSNILYFVLGIFTMKSSNNLYINYLLLNNDYNV